MAYLLLNRLNEEWNKSWIVSTTNTIMTDIIGNNIVLSAKKYDVSNSPIFPTMPNAELISGILKTIHTRKQQT